MPLSWNVSSTATLPSNGLGGVCTLTAGKALAFTSVLSFHLNGFTINMSSSAVTSTGALNDVFDSPSGNVITSIVAAGIDSTHAVVSWSETDASSNWTMRAMLVSVSGDTVTAGSPLTFVSAQNDVNLLLFGVTVRSSTAGSVAYWSSNLSQVTAVSLTYNTGSLTVTSGASATIASLSYNQQELSICALDASSDLVAIRNTTTPLHDDLVIFSGGSFGSSVNVSSGGAIGLNVVQVSNGHAIVTSAMGGANPLNASVVTNSGGTPSVGTAIAASADFVNPDTSAQFGTAVLSSALVVAIYFDPAVANFVFNALDVSGTTLTRELSTEFRMTPTAHVTSRWCADQGNSWLFAQNHSGNDIALVLYPTVVSHWYVGTLGSGGPWGAGQLLS